MMKKVVALLLTILMTAGVLSALVAVPAAAAMTYTAETFYDADKTVTRSLPTDTTVGNMKVRTTYMADLAKDHLEWTVQDWIVADLGQTQKGEGVLVEFLTPFSAAQFPSFTLKLMYNGGGTFYAFPAETTNFCYRNAKQELHFGGSSADFKFSSELFADQNGMVNGVIFQLKTDATTAQFFFDGMMLHTTPYTPDAVTPIDANVYGFVAGGDAEGVDFAISDAEAFGGVAAGTAFSGINGGIYLNGVLKSDLSFKRNADGSFRVAYAAKEGDILSVNGQFGKEYVGPIAASYVGGEWRNALCDAEKNPFIYESLAQNGQFDTSVSGWALYKQESGTANTLSLTGDGYVGKAARITHAAGGSKTCQLGNSTLRNVFAVPGGVYRVHAMVKGTGNIRYGCSLVGSATVGTIVSSNTVVSRDSTVFEALEFTLTVPTDTAAKTGKVCFDFTFDDAAATVVVDEIACYRVYAPGDMNGDGVVDVRDIVRVKKYLAGVEGVKLASLNAADTNCNQSVNALDLLRMRQWVLGRTVEDIPDLKPTVVINGPVGTVYPYKEICRQFIETQGALIKDYYGSMTDSYAPITIRWETVTEDYTGFTVEYATKSDYSDAISVETTEKSLDVYNLFLNTTYYVRVTTHSAKGDVVGESTFRTTATAPRVMKIDGLYNVRDLGGYTTASGTTVQGLIFRGSEMNGSHEITLTPAGDDYMSNVLGIKTDLDLRSPADSNYCYESPISSADLKYVSIGNYEQAFTQKELFREIFSTMAYKANYPIYFHCWGGADRTGTVAYLLNALLGVDSETLRKDWEYTSYTIFGPRDSTTTEYTFYKFIEQFEALPGSTTAEKAENYMLSIGLTADEIYNIRAIMYGNPTKLAVSVPEVFNADEETALKVSYNANSAPVKVTLNGTEVAFGEELSALTVAKKEMTFLPVGEKAAGVITFADDSTLAFSFTYRSSGIVYLSDYLDSETGKVTLNNAKTTVQSNAPVGYGQKVRVDLQTVSGQNGNLSVFVGSYGVMLRGGTYRIWGINASGVTTEIARVGDKLSGAITTFDSGRAYLLIEVDVGDNATIHWSVVNGTTTVCDYSYTVGTSDSTYDATYCHDKRLTDEIKSENAKVTVKIDGTDSGTRSATLKAGTTGGVGENEPVDLTDYLESKTGTLTLDSTAKKVQSDAIGYNEKVKISLKTDTGTNGNLYVLLGSYGIHLRGGSFRIAALDRSGNLKILTRVGESMNCATEVFDEGGYLLLGVAEDHDKMVLSWSVYQSDDTQVCSYSYTIGSYQDDSGRLAEEIPSNAAAVTVMIDGDAAGTKSVQLKTGIAADSTVHDLSEYVDFDGAKSITLDADRKVLVSDTACGYNRKVRFDLQTVSGTNGRLWIYIGSYGVLVRGGALRIWGISSAGTATCIADQVTGVRNCEITSFDDGSKYAVMEVSETKGNIIVRFTLYNENGSIYQLYGKNVDYAYQVGSEDTVGRIGGEIASADAKIRIEIDGDSAGTVSVAVKNHG